MLTEQDLVWLLDNLPIELVQHIITGYNPACLFIMDEQWLLNYNWAKQCKITFDASYNSLYSYYQLCQRAHIQKLDYTNILRYNYKMIYNNSSDHDCTLFDITDISQIAHGFEHSVILRSNGSLLSYGYNAYGQLGLGDHTTRKKISPIDISNIIQIACGDDYTIILKSDGKLMGSGSNFYGQLGLGDIDNLNIFTEIPNTPPDVVKIVCGDCHTLIMTADGTLLGCGSNTYGQMGFGNTNYRTKLEKIPNIPQNIIEIAGGRSYTMILTADGTLMGCGANSDGQLGLGNKKDRHVFEVICKDVKQVRCGTWHTVIMKQDGTLMGCGHNGYKQLGFDSTKDSYTTFTTLPNVPKNVLEFVCTAWNTLIMLDDGRLMCVDNDKPFETVKL